MALPLQELFLIAADLMFASVLSCIFYALGCLVVPGLVGYIVFLSFGAGAMKKAKRSLSQMKEAVQSMVSDSCIGQTVGKILGLAGFRETEEGPVRKEGRSPNLGLKQLPAGEKRCQWAVKTLTGSHPSQTGTACGTKMQSGTIWEEKREMSQKAVLLSLLFAPLAWCLKMRPFRWLAAQLPTLMIPRD